MATAAHSGISMVLLVFIVCALLQQGHCNRDHGGNHNARTTYVLLEVREQCGVELHDVLPSGGTHLSEWEPAVHPLPFHLHQHAVDPTRFGGVSMTAEFATHRFRVSYVDESSGVEMHLVRPDPRLMYLDEHRDAHMAGADGEAAHTCGAGCAHGRPHGTHEGVADSGAAEARASFMETGYLMLWVPESVRSLHVACVNLSAVTPMDISLTRRRNFRVQDAPDGINPSHIQLTGPPDRVNSIVFLSDGFLSSQEGRFNTTVDTIVAMLNNNIDPSTNKPSGASQSFYNDNINSMQNTVPLDRYMPFWNIYKVFQASTQEGCSRPLYGIKVTDNLKCYHSPQLERAIACDHGLAQALASVTPAPVLSKPDSVLIVVVVNTPLYGGTGLYSAGIIHIGQFFNGSGMIHVDQYNAVQGSFDTYASLINHECGHAYGRLLDEYPIGTTATAPYYPWPNCQMPDSTGTTYKQPLPWAPWVSVFQSGDASLISHYRGNADAYLPNTYGTTAVPRGQCGYNNYYAGSVDCMMFHLNAFYMCPSCRQGQSVSIFNTLFELMWPRYPLDDHILLVSQTDATVQGIAAGGVTLHLPQYLTAYNFFSVQWYDENGDFVAMANDTQCPACLFIPSAVLSTWPLDTLITYTAQISDRSVFIHESMWSNYSYFMQQTAYFRMMVPSTPVTPVTPGGNSTSSGGAYVMQYPSAVSGLSPRSPFGVFLTSVTAKAVDQLPILVNCSARVNGTNATCVIEFTQGSYVEPTSIDALAAYDQYVLYILAGVGLVCILLWLYASARYKKQSGRVVRPIFKTEFSCAVTWIRRIMLVSSIGFMFASVSALVASGYFYTKTSFIGKVAIAAGVVVALCLYLMAFVGFWAVTNRAKRLVMFNGVIMIVAECVLIAALAVTNDIGLKINDAASYWGTLLTNWWLSNVATDPNNACGWEGLLKCSGWSNYSCAGSIYINEYCPATCPTYNMNFATSCEVAIEGTIAQWYPIMASALGTGVGLMAVAIAFNYIYYFGLWQLKRSMRERNNERVYKALAGKGISKQDIDEAKALHLLRTLDGGDVESLIREFKRIDVDGNGTLSKQELGLFFRKALCYKISLEELNRLYDCMDIDGDGSISIEEFMAVFRPQDAQRQHLLQLPSGEVPLMSPTTNARQNQVRQRLASTFKAVAIIDGTAAVGSPALKPVAFYPQAQDGTVAGSYAAPIPTAYVIAVNAQPASPMRGGSPRGIQAAPPPNGSAGFRARPRTPDDAYL